MISHKSHYWQVSHQYALSKHCYSCLIGWLCWGLTSQSTIFQSCRDGAIASWVINQYFRGVKCLAQGHNTAEVGLEPRTSRSGVRHSTTEPPRSPLMPEVRFSFIWPCEILENISVRKLSCRSHSEKVSLQYVLSSVNSFISFYSWFRFPGKWFPKDLTTGRFLTSVYCHVLS